MVARANQHINSLPVIRNMPIIELFCTVYEKSYYFMQFHWRKRKKNTNKFANHFANNVWVFLNQMQCTEKLYIAQKNGCVWLFSGSISKNFLLHKFILILKLSANICGMNSSETTQKGMTRPKVTGAVMFFREKKCLHSIGCLWLAFMLLNVNFLFA